MAASISNVIKHEFGLTVWCKSGCGKTRHLTKVLAIKKFARFGDLDSVIIETMMKCECGHKGADIRLSSPTRQCVRY